MNPAGIDPAKNLELTAFNVGTSSGFTKQFGGSTSIDWQPDETLTAYAHLTYAYALTQQDSNLSQIVAMNVLTGSDSPFQTPQGYYQPDLQNISIRYWLETNPEVAELGTFQVGVDKKLDTWTLSPNLFYSWGRDDRPNHIEIDARTSHVQGGDITDNGFPLQPDESRRLLQELPVRESDAGNDCAALQHTRPARVRPGRAAGRATAARRRAAPDSMSKRASAKLLELKFGAKYIASSRNVTFRDWTNPGFFDGTFGSLPIWNGDYNPVFPGKYGWSVPKIDEDKLLGYYGSAADPIKNLDTCGSIYSNSLNCNTQKGTEDIASAYAMAQIRNGDWEVTPGVRFEHTTIHNTFWVIPQDVDGNSLPGYFTSNKTIYNEFLPSIFVNYRPDPGAVYRAGIWTSYTRPAFVKLGGGESVSPSASGATTITVGNPNLKPVKAINYDLSGEWDNGAGRHIVAERLLQDAQRLCLRHRFQSR